MSPSGANGWQWDDSLYRGSAAYYPRGRMPYPAELSQALAAAVGLDGTGRLLDCGCGPGSLTLQLAPMFAEAVGIDADAEMLGQARLAADEAGIPNVNWRHLRAEQLPAGLGEFRLVTFAQSFHWVRQDMVARAVHAMLARGGACVHIFATTHQGVRGDDELASPRPPRSDIEDLIARYLGPVRRAGQGTLPQGPPWHGDTAMPAAGFNGPQRLEVAGGTVQLRTEDEVVASVFSLSGAAPHLFGDRVGEFEAELRELLRASSPDGRFAERMREIAIDIWRPAGS